MVYTLNALEIGKIIKDLRLKQGLSQQALAKGICTQPHISNIENGREVPSGFILYLLSKKLRVNVKCLFDIHDDSNLNYKNNIKFIVQSFMQENDYGQVLKILEDESHLFEAPEDQQYLLWAKAISLYYFKKDLNAAFILLKTALKKTCKCLKFCSEQELTIINSIGILMSESNQNRKALRILKWTYRHIHKHYYIEDRTLPIKNIYAFARSLSRNKDYHNCIRCCNEGIEQCLKYNSLYLFGELYYEKGLNHYFLNHFESALEDFEQAIMLFKLKKQFNFKHFVENKIKELELKKY
ncbi:helix-turn-helix domain-containing protein [Paenibacillus apiarius]|uniref:Helix-turn-helix transcriptional regulator n=1 Tax=Paenibacillus apiarius TaxID=46240 RepID=A0ABT4DV46_9BACL|nr:helix-turn-helix domain-containing protein [Paenibacillus apiarius]MBN3522661.1 helix-turn-helix transcriptional regulator [Paenibacillus apiarius]MCY9513487.1 helix-turn-helix transcriptional regulator [Paenibacillus apiarius]MCY9521214.1 helix-turn-helix transcriptional regulator [Paenibacillus apiarius]MCY9553403.1 helix-turn-helix transcriptional regulator [Paenibacillus apiarius]MCY9559563.1 helix-turn-helix transcriptional regulator [Paenibacillus apiarius]